MGITAGPTYVTDQGFEVSPVYLSLNSYRFQRLPDGKFQCVFGIQAFKSRDDKVAGRAPLNLPTYLSVAESFLGSLDFYRKSIFAHGYDATKKRWQSSGYTVTDIHEPGQIGDFEYIYNAQGYDVDGFNPQGYDTEGYDRTGFNAEGYDRNGYDRTGYDVEGYDRFGYDRDGYTKEGYDRFGYDREGFDRDGYDRAGYDKDGYDRAGYNAEGFDRDGNPRPVIDSSGSVITDLSGSSLTDLSGSQAPPPTSEPEPEAP
jgi:hypothetical protein